MNYNIIVVDDDPGVRRALSEALEFEGYRALSADTAEDAMKMLAENEIHLIILDVMLPGMDGYDFTTKIKNDEKTRDIQIIISSGKDTSAEKMIGLLKGADDYISKPYELSELLLSVRARLKYYDMKKNADFYRTAFFAFNDIFELGPVLEKEKQLGFILTKTADIFSCERSSFFLLDGSGEVKSVLAEGLMTEIKLSSKEGVVGHVVTEKSSYFTNHPYSDKYFTSQVDKDTGFKTENILAVPVWKNDELCGVIELMNRKNGFSEEDIRIAEVYARLFAFFL